MARTFTHATHGHVCPCSDCVLDRGMREQHITHDAPTGSLPAQSVSLRELVDNATLTLPPRYEIGEDWNDD